MMLNKEMFGVPVALINAYGEMFRVLEGQFQDLYGPVYRRISYATPKSHEQLLRLAGVLCLANDTPHVKILVKCREDCNGEVYKIARKLAKGDFTDVFDDDLVELDGEDWELYWAPMSRVAEFVEAVSAIGGVVRTIEGEVRKV